MINILIVDDDIDKIAKVISCIRDKFEDFSIETAVDAFTAQRKLVSKKFEMLILDLHLPFRTGDLATNDGGKILLGEIYRNFKIKSPEYIIGLTQFSESSISFSKIWNVIEYDPNKLDWHEPMVEIISHILKCKRNSSSAVIKTETLFVEGDTDRRIITDALKLFYPQFFEKVIIKSCGGATFVGREAIIWGKSLAKNADGVYIKAVALLDGDEAGDDAKKEIDRVIFKDSAESKTFKVLQLSKKLTKHIIPLYSKGLLIPITFEELFVSSYWQHAESMDWLEKRQSLDNLLANPKSWDKFNISLKEYITSLELSENEIQYTLKFKKEKKEAFCKYIIGLPEEQRKEAYQNIKYMLDEVLVTLSLLTPEKSVKVAS
ncbi:hypothetical protein H9X96_22325 [Pedobacter sp. N36a]|uniref:hypothetical protein n=1 Tax=Pedobacter sp. N36a TaxID=2767996 RepID=UPI001657358A|nr:hypothetical protein [Pedobacter sp. N36a]MBC8988490.1 hypothetical protein [Pedobacter sp. N36a]